MDLHNLEGRFMCLMRRPYTRGFEGLWFFVVWMTSVSSWMVGNGSWVSRWSSKSLSSEALVTTDDLFGFVFVG